MADKRRVKDILLRLKTPVEIKDTEFYKRLTIRINHQGVSLRDTEIGAKIGTKSQFRVRAGDFILSKIDARQGAFGIVPPEADGGIITGNFWTFRVDNQLVDTEWFLQFTNSNAFLDLCKRSSTGNTHRKYLNENVFLNHELTIPSLEEQRKAVAACKIGNKSVEEVQHEITHQQSLLAKLKQAILQEAIQGKLTAAWRFANPDVEPASQLLQRIQAEKKRLAQAKIIKSECVLDPISEKEKQFLIPDSWTWVRVGELCHPISSGSTPDQKIFHPSEGIPFLKVYNLRNQVVDFDYKPQFIAMKHHEERMKRSRLIPGDVIMNIVGPPLGKVAIVPNTFAEWNCNQAIAFFRPIVGELSTYLYTFMQEGSFLKNIQLIGSAGQDNISVTKCKNIPIPLPPLAEQAAIVERVESLMTTCRALEAEIERSRTHAANLLQAVLKEAFAPASMD